MASESLHRRAEDNVHLRPLDLASQESVPVEGLNLVEWLPADEFVRPVVPERLKWIPVENNRQTTFGGILRNSPSFDLAFEVPILPRLRGPGFAEARRISQALVTVHIQVLETSAERQQMLRSNRAQGLADLRDMHDAGMDLLTGTDVGVLNVYPGSSLLDEIAIFVKELGMKPAEAIERATRRPARFLRLGYSIGTVERGKIADLVLLDGDPLADIANIRRISAVVLRGQFHDRESLDRIRAQVLASADLQTDEWGRR